MKKKRSKRRTIPKFYIIYLAVLAAVVILIIASLGIVSGRLAEYEAVQPKYTAEKIFREYFDPINYTQLLADAHYNAGSASESEIADYIAGEIGDRELTYSQGSSTSDDAVTYIVKAGNLKLASINLILSEETTEHGYKTYDFSHIELFLSVSGDTSDTDDTTDEPSTPTYDITINAPIGYTLTLDGTEITAAFISESYEKRDVMKYFPSGTYGITYEKYVIRGLESIPKVFTAIDSEGKEAPFTYDDDALVYDVGITYSDLLAEEYSDFVTEAVTGYSAYMQASMKLDKIKNYFDQSSSLYASIELAGKDLWMVKKPSGYDFEDIEIGEFYRYNTSTISCHISFTQILHRDESEDRPEVIDMYVFLHETDDGYRIYEWYNN